MGISLLKTSEAREDCNTQVNACEGVSLKVVVSIQFHAITTKSEQEITNGMDAHHAEEAIIEALQKLRKTSNSNWHKTPSETSSIQNRNSRQTQKNSDGYSTIGVIQLTA